MKTAIAKALFGLFCVTAVTWFVVTIVVVGILGHALFEGDID